MRRERKVAGRPKRESENKRGLPESREADRILCMSGFQSRKRKSQRKRNGLGGRIGRSNQDHAKIRLYVFGALVVFLMLIVLFAQQVCPYDPNAQIFDVLQAPTREHLLGTDRYGRDMLSRVIVGLRTSVLSTLALVALITVTGTLLGLLAGYRGGIADTIVMRISDVCLAFPGLVFALAIAALTGGGLVNAVFALALTGWPKYARIARSQTLALKNTDFIAAAVLAGDTPRQVVFRHILPNCIGNILVTAVLDIGTMMMELAGLSFLGLGAQPPTAELGNMMSSGRSMLQTYPWVVLAPGAAIFIAVVIFNLLGDALRDWMDPRNGG